MSKICMWSDRSFSSSVFWNKEKETCYLNAGDALRTCRGYEACENYEAEEETPDELQGHASYEGACQNKISSEDFTCGMMATGPDPDYPNY